jgi:hypothetical protein
LVENLPSWPKFNTWLVFVRRFARISASLEKMWPLLALIRPKSVAGIKLRAFDRFKRISVKKITV